MKIALNLLSLMLDKCNQCWWCLLSLATKVVVASLFCGRWIEVKIDCLLILQPFKSQGNLASIMVPNFHRLFPPDSQDFFLLYLPWFLSLFLQLPTGVGDDLFGGEDEIITVEDAAGLSPSSMSESEPINSTNQQTYHDDSDEDLLA